MAKVDGIGGFTGRVVPAGFGQRQSTVRSATDAVGIAVTLSVIVPGANGAGFESAPFAEHEAATAGTAVVRH